MFKCKNDVFLRFKVLKALVKNELEFNVKVFKLDNDSETLTKQVLQETKDCDTRMQKKFINTQMKSSNNDEY